MLVSPRLLVVDDDAALRGCVGEVLERTGCEVHLAATGYEALEVAREVPVDASFLDVEMPGLDGFETARELRLLWADLELVFVTGSGSRENRDRGEALGCFAWLDKPVGPSELVDVALRLARALDPEGGGGRRGRWTA